MAAFTMATGVRTFLTTPTKANLDAAVSDDNVAYIGTANIFTQLQTVRSTGGIRSEVGSTTDAIVLAGRAGGSGTFAVTLTPPTLSAHPSRSRPSPGGPHT